MLCIYLLDICGVNVFSRLEVVVVFFYVRFRFERSHEDFVDLYFIVYGACVL